MKKNKILGKPLQFGDKEQIEWLKKKQKMLNCSPDDTQVNSVDIEACYSVEIHFQCPNPHCDRNIYFSADGYDESELPVDIADDEIDGMVCPQCECEIEFNSTTRKVKMKPLNKLKP